jgi:hypothetical protein
MVYGDEKTLEMARSLLPSTNREPARKSRVTTHRAERRRVRLQAARLTRDPEDSEDLPGPDKGPDVEIRQMVRWRREGDKVAPFIRWAKARARAMPQESRMSHIRSLVPQGVIGEHALFHLRHQEDFEHPSERALRELRREAWSRSWLRGERLDRGEQAERLRAVLKAAGGHRALNTWLRARYVFYRRHALHAPRALDRGCTLERAMQLHLGPTPIRLLLGLHDVLPFLEALWGRRLSRWGIAEDAQPEQLHAVDEFIQAFKRCRGDVEAVARELRL